MTDATQRAAAQIGLAGGALGVVAGSVELLLGESIRSWVGDKSDTTRLGLTTIVLAVLAVSSAAAIGSRLGDDAPRRLLLATGMLLPGLIGFTTTGRLWWAPGTVLVVATVVAVRHLSDHRVAIAVAVARHLATILTAVLGVLCLALGMTAHGVAAVAGIVGGIMVIALVAMSARLRPAVLVADVALAITPFAAVTWWSIVTPLLAVVTVAVAGWSTTQSRRATAVRCTSAMRSSSTPSSAGCVPSCGRDDSGSVHVRDAEADCAYSTSEG
jgi:hypothetical protein